MEQRLLPSKVPNPASLFSDDRDIMLYTLYDSSEGPTMISTGLGMSAHFDTYQCRDDHIPIKVAHRWRAKGQFPTSFTF